eukprot:3385687-Alexandrium_andersonii.AAC.1
MSASLVGSEMCIRDSAQPAEWRAKHVQARLAGFLADLEKSLSQGTSTGCLLYTSDAADDM